MVTISEQECYEAGKDAALNGGNDSNTHFLYFTQNRFTKAWQKGYDEHKQPDQSGVKD